MSNCVIRFGGNSFSHISVLEAFASLLIQEKERNVVISAIPELLKIIEQSIDPLKDNSISSEQIINNINEIISQKLSVFDRLEIAPVLKDELNELYKLLKGIEYTGDCSNVLKDQVISYAERISALILNLFLETKQVESNLVLPESIGLIVTGEFGNASILYEESLNLQSFLPLGLNLIPGSYGITIEGKIARLGKSSADYSAAAITLLSGADSLELWEVDKEFKTSDSLSVPDSKIIPRLTYDEASELSYFSELSIHPRIVEPLIGKHIPIRIYRLTKVGKELTTTINSESYISPDVVKSIVHTDEIAILKLNGSGVGFKPGILAKVTSAFHRSGINIRSVITSQVSINMILNKNEIELAHHICTLLDLSSVSEIVIQDQVSLIGVVGQGMQQFHGVSAKLFTAVAQHKINVLLSGSGASDLVSYLIVDQKDTQKAISEIHKIFFNSN